MMILLAAATPSFLINPLETVLSALALAAAAGIAAGARKLFQKWGLELSAEAEAHIKDDAFEIILWVEELAADELAKRGSKMPSEDKANKAIDALRDKHPGLSLKEAKQRIDAALARNFMGAAAKAKSFGVGNG